MNAAVWSARAKAGSAVAKGALLTGCRRGEDTRMQVADFNAEAGTITVREQNGQASACGAHRRGPGLFGQLYLLLEAVASVIFTREDGEAWGKSHQARPLEEGDNARAKIDPPATFTFCGTITLTLASRGVRGIAAQQSQRHEDD